MLIILQPSFMSYLLLTLVALISSAVVLANPESCGRTYVVDQNLPAASDDGPGNGTRPFKTINQATRAAKAGDMVQLHAGVFTITEPIQLKSGMKFIGAGQDKTRIDYGGTRKQPLMRIDGCEDVEVAHLTLDGEDNPLVADGMTGGNSRRLSIHHVTIISRSWVSKLSPEKSSATRSPTFVGSTFKVTEDLAATVETLSPSTEWLAFDAVGTMDDSAPRLVSEVQHSAATARGCYT